MQKARHRLVARLRELAYRRTDSFDLYLLVEGAGTGSIQYTLDKIGATNHLVRCNVSRLLAHAHAQSQSYAALSPPSPWAGIATPA